MAIDQNIVDQAAEQLLAGNAQSFLRRQERADEVAGQALEDVRTVAAKQRTNFLITSDLVLNRIISDQTGSDDMISERTLTGREVQAQPQENTFDDPNYRPGASPPTAPPSPTKST